MLQKNINIVGAGSVGSFVAMHLAFVARNVPLRLFLYDHDVIESHNTVNQVYRASDLGRRPAPKVDALARILKEFSPVGTNSFQEKVSSDTPLSGIVIVTVDTLAERRNIFKAAEYNGSVPLYVDARSGGEEAVVYAFDPRDSDHVRRYLQTLDGPGTPAPCADARTIPTLFVIASVICRLLDSNSYSSASRFIEVLINYRNMPIIQTTER